MFQSLVITRLPFNQTYTLQGSKLNFLKSRLLANFSCKMVAIEIIWSPKSSHQWEDISYCVTGVFTVVNSTKHRWILRFFFKSVGSQLATFAKYIFVTPHVDQNSRNLERCTDCLPKNSTIQQDEQAIMLI